MNIKFVLDNEIDRTTCRDCGAVWFRFNATNAKLGIYRLAFNEPISCYRCFARDQRIEADPGFVASSEQWFDLHD